TTVSAHPRRKADVAAPQEPGRGIAPQAKNPLDQRDESEASRRRPVGGREQPVDAEPGANTETDMADDKQDDGPQAGQQACGANPFERSVAVKKCSRPEQLRQ